MSGVTVLTGPERRRRWSALEKAGIVDESDRPGAIVAAVARQHGVHPNLLHHWRQQAREGRLGGEVSAAFVPVEITSSPAAVSTSPAGSASLVPARRPRSGMIEIELGNSCRVRVDRDVDADALRRVLDVLRRR